MQIGIKIEETPGPWTLDGWVARVREAAVGGFASAWLAPRFGWDELTTLAVIGREVPRIALGTAIVQTYPRHPLVLASQALTVQAAVGDRLQLGVGPGARPIIEGAFGYPYETPGRHTREYLAVLAPLLRGENVAYEGETVKAAGEVRVPVGAPPSLLLSALGPVMLRLAGELTDGTITTMTGPVGIADHIVPTLSRAAEAAGRPAPRVLAEVLVSVSADEAGARAWFADRFGFLGRMPTYRAMLDREGAAGVGDAAVVGDESAVAREVRRHFAAGATEVIACPFGPEEDQARTIALLAELARA